MAYGGLRGAIAFSLAVMLDKEHILNTDLFITTTLFVILFTVFILGSTTKPLVKLLRVKAEQKTDPKMFIFIHDKSIDTFMAGMEEIAGQRHQHFWFEKLSRFNDRLLKPFLIKGGCAANGYTARYERVRHDRPHSVYHKMFRRSREPSDLVEQEKVVDKDIAMVQLREKERKFSEPIIREEDESSPRPETMPSGVQEGEIFLKSKTMPSRRSDRPLRRFHSQASPTRVRRTLSSAFHNSLYYQLPGSISSVDKDPHELRRTSRMSRPSQSSSQGENN